MNQLNVLNNAPKRCVGITERGDAGLDFTWVDKLDKCLFTILITKDINDTFIEKVAELQHQHRLIVHATITGLGDSILEPKVRHPVWSFEQLEKLCQVFPRANIVGRVDPIVTTHQGLRTAIDTMEKFIARGIERIRYSFIDIYPHVAKRLKKAGIVWNTGNDLTPLTCQGHLRKIFSTYPTVTFESCAEGSNTDTGCISEMDFETFGLDTPTIGRICGTRQRKHCKCHPFKTELLEKKKRCPNFCLYCYWYD